MLNRVYTAIILKPKVSLRRGSNHRRQDHKSTPKSEQCEVQRQKIHKEIHKEYYFQVMNILRVTVRRKGSQLWQAVIGRFTTITHQHMHRASCINSR